MVLKNPVESTDRKNIKNKITNKEGHQDVDATHVQVFEKCGATKDTTAWIYLNPNYWVFILMIKKCHFIYDWLIIVLNNAQNSHKINKVLILIHILGLHLTKKIGILRL